MTDLSFTAIQGIFLIAAAGLTAVADLLVLRWLGRVSWPRAAAGGLLALVPFAVVLAVYFLFLDTSHYESQAAWTMTFGLPLLIFLALLLLAWMAKTILLCLVAGARAGLAAGLVVFPLLWTGVLSSKGLLWKGHDALHESDPAEAVGHGSSR